MVRGVLIDLDGVVYVGNRALPGSLEAIRRIRESGIPFKFITNTTRRPRRRIVSDLARLGLDIVAEDLFTPAALARDFLARQNLVPLLIVHPRTSSALQPMAARPSSLATRARSSPMIS
jgi:ribonucleotide monophosphatase NagD (HAD superfamily)